MAANEVQITVTSRDKTKSGFDGAEKGAKGLKKTLGDVGKVAGGFIAANVVAAGAAKLTAFVKGSVTAASDLGESLNAVNKIFDSSAGQIQKWGKDNAVSFGLSQRAFNDLAVPLGAVLKNSGMAMKDVSGNTIDLTKRAADMASVFNTDVKTAMEAINSGLKGEADPLEAFGVGLSAAKVEAEALANTGKKSAKSLTEQEKMTARLNLIMKQTKDVAGDFRGTSDGLANSQRIAAAKTEELQAKIGQHLIPVTLLVTKAKAKLVEVLATKLVPVLSKVAAWLGKHPAALKALAIVVGGILVVAFVAWAAAAASAAVATIAATWPVLAIIAAIAALAAGLVYAYKHWDWFRIAVDKNVRFLKDVAWPAIKAFAGFVKDAFRVMVAAVLDYIGFFINAAAKAFGWIPGIGPKLKDAAKAFDNFKARVNKALSGIRDRNVRVTVNGQSVGVRSRSDGSVVLSSGGGRNIARAHGGLVGAAAGGIRGNLVEVGEHGRELLDLPPGTNVHSNPDTERMLSGGRGGSVVRLVIDSGGSKLDDLLVEVLRKAVRVRGGDVQLVLGRG